MIEALPGPDSDIEALRRFASVKLIVADLDGTLFPSELGGTAQRLLRQLNRAHVQLTVATGRTHRGIRELLHKLQDVPERPLIKRGTPLILYNGSVVVEAITGHLLRRQTISEMSMRAVMKCASAHVCELFAYFYGEGLFDEHATSSLHERVVGLQFNLRSTPRIEHEFNGIPIEWSAGAPETIVIREPCAVLLRSEGDSSDLIRVLSAIEGVTVTKSGAAYIELRPIDSNKGAALAWTAQRLGLSPSDVLAVGDNDNDVEMLAWAGTGVAVNTASTAAQAHSDFLCDLGPFQGVVQVLRLVHQAHRYFRDSPRSRPIAT